MKRSDKKAQLMSKKHCLQVDEIGEVYLRRHRRARHMRIRVEPDATVMVTIPWRASSKRAIAFVNSQRNWILERMRQCVSIMREHASLVSRSGIEGREEAARLLRERLSELAIRHGFRYYRTTIRNQKTRWGSCSASDSISLNYKLAYLPSTVRDYVLLHELVHTVHKNHGPAFWRRLRQVCPEADEARKELRSYHPQLLEPVSSS